MVNLLAPCRSALPSPQASHPGTEGEFVWVDPHIMTTPAIADIDGDGHDELVVAVSYFYDRWVRVPYVYGKRRVSHLSVKR